MERLPRSCRHVPKNSVMQLRAAPCHRWADSAPPSGALSCKEHCGVVVGLYVKMSDHVKIATPLTVCCATLRHNAQFILSGTVEIRPLSVPSCRPRVAELLHASLWIQEQECLRSVPDAAKTWKRGAEAQETREAVNHGA